MAHQHPQCPVVHGDWSIVPPCVQDWVWEKIEMCQPDALHIISGSDREDAALKAMLVEKKVITPLTKYEGCYLARTDPKDVARVESKTYMVTPEERETVPHHKDGVKGTLGNWLSPADLEKRVQKLFPGCMKGRTMYLIPYSMGPIGSHLSKNGIELTDSAYVAICMRVMTRVSTQVLHCIRKDEHFVKCLHSVGKPLKPGEKDADWPCNPADVMIAHKTHEHEIISFGSGYGGNSLLGKKCFALRIGSVLAHEEGWLAEHMLIMGLQRPDSAERKYICAAFPSACGKTNLAMLNPSLEGYKVTCVGDDIAWLHFDEKGDLRAINPEHGFFGVSPGTSYDSNPVAMDTIFKDTIFTNVALTDDGGVWWEGMTKDAPSHLIDWLGQDWTPGCGRNAAHPNSRFCAPFDNCPISDDMRDDPNGVKIEAILFGGRRPEGVPLVVESFDWDHGVFLGACLKSEATAAAEHKGKMVMHDPFSMRPFFGYNFGFYLEHWLKLGKTHKSVPKIFMVNWFRRSVQHDGSQGGFLWPGFRENIRVLDWVFRRCNNESGITVNSAVGVLPTHDSINLKGLEDHWDELFSTPKQFWEDEIKELEQYFADQVGDSLPKEISEQLTALKKRVDALKE